MEKNKETMQAEDAVSKQTRVAGQIQKILEDNNMALEPFIVPRVRLVEIQNESRKTAEPSGEAEQADGVTQPAEPQDATR